MAIINKNIITDEARIDELLTRGVEDIIEKEDLKKALMSQEQLRIKLGIDPTGPKIHLGRAIVIRKLREFQKLGHQVVLIIGDFTAQIGDASDKTEKRPMLTREKIDENLKDYKSQIGKILDLSKTEFVYNNDWLGKMTFGEVTKLAEVFTVQQMLSRRNFKERHESGKEISLREFLYPIMQGYDSVAVRADVELGGFDQLFNLKAGRYIQDSVGIKPQNIITFEMLEGTDGRKMSTSWGNIVTIVDEPSDMYGKIMSVRDDLIVRFFTLCTDVSMEQIDEYKNFLEDKSNNPRDIKMILAKTIVSMYHDEMSATKAEKDFIETFQKGGIPEVMDEVSLTEEDKEKSLGDVLVEKDFVKSKAEWKRLVESKAVKSINTENENIEEVVDDFKTKVSTGVFKIGKKTFVRVV